MNNVFKTVYDNSISLPNKYCMRLFEDIIDTVEGGDDDV